MKEEMMNYDDILETFKNKQLQTIQETGASKNLLNHYNRILK